MPTTFDAARDEILGAFRTRWEADAAAIVGFVPDVFYDGVPRTSAPSPDKPWADVTIRHTSGAQATLAQDTGKRRFEKTGIVTVGVFAPLGQNRGLEDGEKLAMVAKKAFEGKATAGGVWFRNVRISEVGQDGPWFAFQILAEMRYDEFV